MTFQLLEGLFYRIEDYFHNIKISRKSSVSQLHRQGGTGG
ncbi:hypothetical protein CLOSTHATH_05764 [Hungatella hathewayi DSM 13479]|uniref:Uncharacterized protein n=1 Tax=Hungatella hathewayi DSM 13479 TaxID=566550 RepID=D3AQ58_9FIRM|nr:hypothetical protein CLOSTHATH_05764 [Hungatella hathewayi DSM 13479]